MKNSKLNILAISMLSLAALATLSACGTNEKSQKFLLESETIAYKVGTVEDLSSFEEIGLGTEEAIKERVKNVYTSNSFGNLGGLLLSNEMNPAGTYNGKSISPKSVNYTHKSDFEKVGENEVDPVNSLCVYTKERENVKFYSMKIDPISYDVNYVDYVVTSGKFTYLNGDTKSIGSSLTDSSIKVKGDVMNATFNLTLTVDDISIIEMDIATVWNLEK